MRFANPAHALTLMVLLTLPIAAHSAGAGTSPTRQLPPAFGAGGFVENAGQTDRDVLFHAGGPGFTVTCTRGAILVDAWTEEVLAAGPHRGPTPAEERSVQRHGRVIRLSFAGGSARAVTGIDRSATMLNYCIGSDPSSWIQGAPVYGAVRYRDVWPGVDLVYSLDSEGLSCRVESDSPAAARAVDFIVEGSGDGPAVGRDGSFPFLRAGESDPKEARGPRALRDDPSSLLWSTYLGGTAEELGWSVAAGRDGHAYVTGVTFSSSFPTTPGAYDRVYSGLGDVFISKLAPDGASLVWSTFLGGSAMNFDYGYDITLGIDDAPFVTGYTWSTDFPTTPGAYDRTHNGTVDAFVSKLDAGSGNLLWSSFLGGESHDIGYSIDLDSAGNPVVAGRTVSVFFPVTAGVYDDSQNGEEDVFVTKFSAAGDDILWSTYVGGSAYDGASEVRVGDADNVLLVGATASGDYPGGSYAGGIYDAFVTKLTGDGSALAWSRLIGGGGADFANGLALDEVADVFLCGATSSPDFPVTDGAFDEEYNADDDAYVAKLSSGTGAILWATFLGGTDPVYETAFGIDVDSRSRPVVAGSTPSHDFPVTENGYDTYHNGASDVFVARLSADGSALEWSTFLGGDGDDYGWDLVLDRAGYPTVAGVAGSASFPTTPGAFDTTYNGDISDVFVARFRAPLDPAAAPDAALPAPSALTVLPQPLTGTGRLAFDLTEPSPVTLEVLDASGRVVRTIAEGFLPKGSVMLDWDGREESGHPLPAGSYFLRLRAGSVLRVARVTVVR